MKFKDFCIKYNNFCKRHEAMISLVQCALLLTILTALVVLGAF